jgi:hypothetical protein
MSNPYQPPVNPSPVDPARHSELKQIAQAQKNVLYIILLRLILIPIYGGVAIGLREVNPALAQPVIGLVDVVVAIVALLVIYQLAAKVYSQALAVVFALTQCVPCLGLIVLLVVNGKATKTLQEAGIRVGLMGADMSQFQ